LIEADDSDILTMLASAGKAGIDCPLGWPDAFVAFVSAHSMAASTCRCVAVSGIGDGR